MITCIVNDKSESSDCQVILKNWKLIDHGKISWGWSTPNVPGLCRPRNVQPRMRPKIRRQQIWKTVVLLAKVYMREKRLIDAVMSKFGDGILSKWQWWWRYLWWRHWHTEYHKQSEVAKDSCSDRANSYLSRIIAQRSMSRCSFINKAQHASQRQAL